MHDIKEGLARQRLRRHVQLSLHARTGVLHRAVAPADEDHVRRVLHQRPEAGVLRDAGLGEPAILPAAVRLARHLDGNHDQHGRDQDAWVERARAHHLDDERQAGQRDADIREPGAPARPGLAGIFHRPVGAVQPRRDGEQAVPEGECRVDRTARAVDAVHLFVRQPGVDDRHSAEGDRQQAHDASCVGVTLVPRELRHDPGEKDVGADRHDVRQRTLPSRQAAWDAGPAARVPRERHRSGHDQHGVEPSAASLGAEAPSRGKVRQPERHQREEGDVRERRGRGQGRDRLLQVEQQPLNGGGRIERLREGDPAPAPSRLGRERFPARSEPGPRRRHPGERKEEDVVQHGVRHAGSQHEHPGGVRAPEGGDSPNYPSVAHRRNDIARAAFWRRALAPRPGTAPWHRALPRGWGRARAAAPSFRPCRTPLTGPN